MFIDEKIEELGILSAIPNQFTITNYSNRIVVIEGKINLISVTMVKIALTVSNHPIEIEGENLTLKYLSKDCLTIIGNKLIIK